MIARAKEAAVEVLLHNAHGPYKGLPRAAGWGYPEPYTRDLMISSLGILLTGNAKLIESLQKTLETAAKNQSPLGHIPSLVHDREDRGSSDCTALFLIAVALFRQATKKKNFLEQAVSKAMLWMEHQSPTNRVLVAQLPTSDWRDEQWVLGYGLYVNTLVYAYLRLYGQHRRAADLMEQMGRFTIRGDRQNRHVHEGLVLPNKPYYALWAYKVYRSERFDLLGNSLAILTGIASASRASRIVSWVEAECRSMRKNGDLAADLPPNFFPFIRPQDPDWIARYAKYNNPGEYHNGGIWPFVCGFYVAALVAAGKNELAAEKLSALAELVKPWHGLPARAGTARPAPSEVEGMAVPQFGFNEWFKAQDGSARGEDWQSWSAAMFLYAAVCVEQKNTPFFDNIRRFTRKGANV
jgi:hypothetical protein